MAAFRIYDGPEQGLPVDTGSVTVLTPNGPTIPCRSAGYGGAFVYIASNGRRPIAIS
jgi:hypothetical protein